MTTLRISYRLAAAALLGLAAAGAWAQAWPSKPVRIVVGFSAGGPTDVVDAMGFAGEVGLSMNAGDVADFRVNLSRRDPNFRQLGENPSFLTTSGVSVGTTVTAAVRTSSRWRVCK